MGNSVSVPLSLDGIVSPPPPHTTLNGSHVLMKCTVHDTTHFNELLVSNKGNGYRDLTAVIDLSTYRRLAWEKNMPLFLCSFIVPETGEWLAVDPRSALRVITEKYEKKGLKCMSGAEFEVGILF